MSNKASRVLIVDDMPINRIILASLLASNGINSDQVETGQECLELCRKKEYDLILLDHRMPELDGVDTLVQLKQIFEEKGRKIPVVCHTTEDARNNINLYKAAGFAEVLIKPIDPKELSDILMAYLPEGNKEEESADPEEEEARDELDRLPIWLKSVPKIDLITGLKKCGSAEDYLDALFVFASSIETKAAEIETFFKKQNLNMFTLRVHSLKSIARLVGAEQLADDAAFLEVAGKEDDFQRIYQYTPSLLVDYRTFGKLLAPILDEEESLPVVPHPAVGRGERQNDEASKGVRRVLFVEGTQGSIVNKGIYKHLEDAGFVVFGIPDEPDAILSHRLDANLVLYYPGGSDVSHIHVVASLLFDICRDEGKTLCLVGDAQNIETAQAANTTGVHPHVYPRPVNLNEFIKDMKRFADRQVEFHRRKTILIVDDDPDYLSIIRKWLSENYHVQCFSSGDKALEALAAIKPDLILLDYEMPEMDGYDLMKRIKSNPRTYKIPIIFLTGKNDRNHVIRILEHKPDGYLLKSSKKESLMDAIARFFSESILRADAE